MARGKYGARFPIMTKGDVNGEEANGVYNTLRSEFSFKEEDKEKGEIPWNFAKFLVSGEGKVLSYHGHGVERNELIPTIKEFLDVKSEAVEESKTPEETPENKNETTITTDFRTSGLPELEIKHNESSGNKQEL